MHAGVELIADLASPLFFDGVWVVQGVQAAQVAKFAQLGSSFVSKALDSPGRALGRCA